ncbi:hypothetical protein SteCoe_30308 [Stentor coeruleus]|uniref:Tyrosine-protein kinase ephrin type A/B receptor-like domain-containing protein n=1 Tax=Stentor coeruleus TaxID=5963 RepID=A0A1R2B3Z7_9CILI|nr:hypothetical protein SteCoe_30308 [Stentor coeruleus]
MLITYFCFFGFLFISSSKYLNLINKNSIPPEKRNACKLIYHEKNDCLYLFGGTNEKTKFNDIWAFYFSDYTWERIEVSSSSQPAPRKNSLFFKSKDNDDIIYMFGGSDVYGTKSDLWEFSLKSIKWKYIKNFLEISSRISMSIADGIFRTQQVIIAIGGKTLDKHYYDMVIIYLQSLQIVDYPNCVVFNQNGIIYTYGGLIFRAWGNYDLLPTSLVTEAFIDGGSVFYFLNMNVIDISYTALYNSLVYSGNYLYIFTGYNLQGERVPYVFRADLNNPGNLFDKISLLNFTHRALPGLTVKNDKFYIFGGFNDLFTNEMVIAEADIPNNALKSIMTIKEYNYPEERVYFSLDTFDHRLVLFGGYNKGYYFNDLWIYYSKTNIWESIEMKGYLPSRRKNHASGAHGNSLVIWGGEDKAGFKNDIFINNILKKSWSEIKPSNLGPSPRKGACGVLKFPKFYIFGGQTYAGLSGEAWEYSFNTNHYTQLSKSPEAFYNGKCQLLFNKIYIVGAKNIDNIGLNKILYYDIIQNSWGKSYEKEKGVYYAESVSMIFPDYFIEHGGVFKNIYANKQINAYRENGEVYGPWEQKWSVFAGNSAYVLSKIIYFSGGLEGPSVSITKERSNNKFNYISVSDLAKDLNFTLYCAPGSYLNKNGNCNYCPFSSYSTGFTEEKCKLCPPGTKSENFGLASLRQCYPCEEGSFNSKSGQKYCRKCPSNGYCPVGSAKPQFFKLSYLNSSIQPMTYQEPSFNQSFYMLFIISYSIFLFFFTILLFLIPKVVSNIHKLDLYITAHDNEIGKPIKIAKTKIGGAFTIIFFGVGLFIFGLNVINYALKNVEETKSLQPLSVFENEVSNFKSDINITVSFENYFDECGINGECQYGVEIVVINIVKGAEKIKCQKINYACVIQVVCNNCEIGTTSMLTFKLSQEYSFSTAISVKISSESSIPESLSSMSKTIIAPKDEVFIGRTSSQFYYSLTPSVFYSTIKEFPNESTGYHISEYALPTYGTSFTIENLNTESGLTAVINLERSAFGFFTYRYEIQTVFIVFSAILGSIAGIFQVIGFVMGFVEGIVTNYEKKALREEHISLLIENRLRMQISNNTIKDYKNKRHDSYAEDRNILLMK